MPNRLRELREQRGLTRVALALRLNPPTTERTVARWEALEVAIPDERKVELARLFRVGVGELIDWDGLDRR